MKLSWIAKYWRVISQLFSSPKYYFVMLKRPLWPVLRVFGLSMLLLGLVWTGKINMRILPELEQQVEQAIDELEQNYPEDLVVNWDGETLQWQPNELVEIPFPSILKDLIEIDDVDLQYSLLGLMVPGNPNQDTLENDLEREAVIIATESNLYVNDPNAGLTGIEMVTALEEESFEITKSSLTGQLEQVRSDLVQFFQSTKILSPLIVPILTIIKGLWAALIRSLFLYIFIKILYRTWAFSNSLKLTLLIGIVAETVTQIGGWLYSQSTVDLYGLTYWLVLMYVLWVNRKKISSVK